MTYKATTIEEYCTQIPEERKVVFNKLLNEIQLNLPPDFESGIQYNMPSFFVPKSIYPPGYHCTPSEPLPFISIASQKGFIALYHLGLYISPEIYSWFVVEFEKIVGKKPDMGKSCIRFKKPELIPLELIGLLCTKITVEEWIKIYEENITKK